MILHTNTPETPLPAQKIYLEYIRPTAWDERPKWRLLSPIYFDDVVVPAGFITDLGTIPRIFWAVFDPVNTYAAATIIHDYRLEQGRNPDDGKISLNDRKLADQLFQRALHDLDVSGFRLLALSVAVKSFSRITHLFKIRSITKEH